MSGADGSQAGQGHLSDAEMYRQLAAASRATSRDLLKDPVTLARGLDRTYRMRPHLKVIGEAMAGVERGDYDRLLIIMPPQVGKSTSVAEWLPFWWLCIHPEDRVAVATYSDDLALKRGKTIRGYVEEYGTEYGLSLQAGSGAMQDWSLTRGGGVRSVSVGKGLTGFPVNCVAGEALIQTPHGPIPIGAYVESGSTDLVLAFDHDRDRAVWAPVTATSISEKETVEVITRAGRVVRCTADHRLYVPGRGYVPAGDLYPGYPLITWSDNDRSDVCAVQQAVPPDPLGDRRSQTQREPGTVLREGMLERRQEEEGSLSALQELRDTSTERMRHDVLLTGMQALSVRSDATVRPVRRSIPDRQSRPREGGQERADGVHLLLHLRGKQSRPDESMRGMRQRDAEQGVAEGPLLLAYLQEGQPSEEGNPQAGRKGLRTLRNLVPAQGNPERVLLPGLREPGALSPDDRRREFALHRRHLVRCLVPEDASAGPRPGRTQLRGLQGAGDLHDDHPEGQAAAADDLPCAPHQRGPARQPAGEPGKPLQDVPRDPPQVEHDAVAVVRHLLGQRIRVYDLQVEGTGNFFAGQILVHNCLIVDDPHKDRADAESARSRQHVHDWYSSVALKRLQPDRNAVVGILTRWHEDDWAGRRITEEGRLEGGGRWKVVHLAAIADPKFGPDPLGRAAGEPLPHPKIPTRDRVALLAWWHDMKRTSTVRDWHSLAQGDPQPSEGALVSEELLRILRDTTTRVEPQKVAVAVDPSGGGRDTAGIVGGFLGDDDKLWITHDRSGVMSSADWAKEACRLAYETDAAIVFVETNYGGDMAELALHTAWKALQDDETIPKKQLPPKIDAVRAKQGKLLRAEPIAQQMVLDRVRLRGLFVDLEREWATWMPTDPASPGRIDASVYLAYGLLQGIAGMSEVISPAGVSREQVRAGGLGGVRIHR